MGTFIYGNSLELEIEDRTLEHLRFVIFQKLRGQESFSLTWQPPGTPERPKSVSMWIGPGIPLRFELDDNAAVEISREWVESLMRMSYSARGLWITSECAPPEASP